MPGSNIQSCSLFAVLACRRSSCLASTAVLSILRTSTCREQALVQDQGCASAICKWSCWQVGRRHTNRHGKGWNSCATSSVASRHLLCACRYPPRVLHAACRRVERTCSRQQ